MSGALVSPLAAWLSSLVSTAAGVLHSSRYGAELGASEYPQTEEDRTLDLRYLGSDVRPFAGSCRRLLVSFEARIAYRYDLDLATVGGDAGVSRTTIARLRAADDAAVIREACVNAANYGASSNAAIITDIRVGAHAIEDQGDGVLVSSLPMILEASYDPATLAVGAALT